MTDSQYPDSIDDDVVLPRVDDNITEIGGEAINGCRSAIFNIEETLGTNPQGTAADVATRLAESLNPDGSIKASALSSVGLVTLPIDNAQVGTNAGIEESKLDLDYSTATLRQLIASLDAFIMSINNRLIIDISNLTQHVAHPSAYGRHRTSDIDGYTGKYSSYNAQGMIDDLDTRLINHVTDTIDAHDASAISFVDTGLTISADDVQEALELLDELQATLMTKHRDDMHSNGILKEQEVYVDGYVHSTAILSDLPISAVSPGDTSITFTGGPIAALAQVSRGDKIEVTIGGQTFVKYVESVVTISDSVLFFGVAPFGGSGATASIYYASEEIIAPSALMMAIKKKASGTQEATVQIIHPSAPYLLSSGIDTGQLSPTVKNIQVKWPTGYAEIDAYGALNTYTSSADPSTWTTEVLALALNESFRPDGILASSVGLPLLAFTYRGELGLAYDEPDGYLIAEAPGSGNSAWAALGFTGVEEAYSLGPRRFYIDGYEFTGIRTILNGTGKVEGGSPELIEDINVDLTDLGIPNQGVVRVTGSSGDGTYIFNATTSSTIRIDEYPLFSVDPSVDVKIYADHFTTGVATKTLYELFLDAYENGLAELRGSARVEYSNTAGASPDWPEDWFDVVDVSRTFGASEKRIEYREGALTLGDRSGATGVTNTGPAVLLPTSNEEGFRFKLYDGNGVDYLEIEIAEGDYVGETNVNAIDVEVLSRASEERYVQVATVLYDTNDLKYLSDKRLFGSVGRRDVRDDYTRDYITYPTSLLRGNGIIYGLEVFDSSTDVGIKGGQVVVDGIIYAVESTVITCPKNYSFTTYNLFVDNTGKLRLLEDNQYIYGVISTPPIEEIVQSKDKTLLAQVVVDFNNNVDSISDYRRFVGDVDNNFELILENNDGYNVTHGTFSTFGSVINWINLHDSAGLPIPRLIRLRGNIDIDVSDGTTPISFPDGITFAGDATSWDDTTTMSTITLSGITSSGVIRPGDGFTMKNIKIDFTSGATVKYLVGSSITDLTNMTLENCVFANIADENGLMETIRGKTMSNVNIVGCSFEYTENFQGGFAITCTSTVDNLFVSNCLFTCTDIDESIVFMSFSGTTTRMTVLNTKFESSARLSTWAIGALFGSIEHSLIDNCVFDITSYPGAIADGYFGIATSDMTNTTISNCRFIDSGAGDKNMYGVLGPGENTTISGCSFEDQLIGVVASNDAYGIIISNNIFDGIGTAAINANTHMGGMIIEKNFFRKTAKREATDVFITLKDPEHATIRDNLFIMSASDGNYGEMIQITNTSKSTAIINNYLFNTAASGQGFEVGIYFDGDAGTQGADHKLDCILNNHLYNFGGGNAIPISITNGNETLISGNKTFGTTTGGIYMFDCKWATIVDNSLMCNIGTAPVLEIDGSGGGGVGEAFNLISQNTFHNAQSAGLDNIVEITANGGERVIFSNNIVRQYVSTSFALVLIQTNFVECIGNFFSCYIANNTYMLNVSGTYALVALNNLAANTFPYSGGRISVSDDTSVDFMNKGGTYYSVIPMSRAFPDTGSSWAIYAASNPHKLELTNPSGTSEEAYIEFSNLDVPTHARIVQLDVNAQVSATDDLAVTWYKDDWEGGSSAGDTISLATNPDSTGAYLTFDVVPSSGNDPQYMMNDEVHLIKFRTDDPLSGAVWVAGLRIKYIL